MFSSNRALSSVDLYSVYCELWSQSTYHRLYSLYHSIRRFIELVYVSSCWVWLQICLISTIFINHLLTRPSASLSAGLVIVTALKWFNGLSTCNWWNVCFDDEHDAVYGSSVSWYSSKMLKWFITKGSSLWECKLFLVLCLAIKIKNVLWPFSAVPLQTKLNTLFSMY